MRFIGMLWSIAAVASAAPDGAAIYRDQCASCHGPNGEGVAKKYDEALFGNRSIEALAKYIDRNMPEEEQEKCVGDDALAVAQWIHGAFYSPAARARLHPARIDLTRLTNEQYRQSIADLVGSFGGRAGPFAGDGLQGKYFNAEKMDQQKEHLLDRLDPHVLLDKTVMDGIPKLKRDSFSVTWNGSLFAPESGDYGIRAVTENGVRVFLNALPWAQDRPELPLIDGWVSRGETPRVEEARIPLVGGRAYPLRIQYLSYGQKSASLRFEWKPPGGIWELVPTTQLSKAWTHTVAVATTAFPPDDASYGYERGSAISREWHEAVLRSALEIADFVMPEIDRMAGTKPDAADRADKLRAFGARFAERAFRRPLADAQRDDLLKEFANLDGDTAVRRLLVRVLCSPRFLYPALGGPAGDDFSVAANLALVLWDSLPDDTLWQAAAAGQLKTKDQATAQATRMLENPRARQKIRGFFDHWLAIGQADRLAKDPLSYPAFDERLVADLKISLERFVDEVVWGDRSDYRDLLLADYIYMNRRMADYYGVPAPAGEDFGKVSLPPAQRAGVLTHPYLLASLAYYKSSSPIHRGVFLTRKVLGRFLKPPPMAIVFMDDRFDPNLTMREKVTQLTDKPACMACHEMINPLGFSLENFDATGRWRVLDSGKPVDPHGNYTTSSGEVVGLAGPRDLAIHSATSPEASLGFVRQLFQHCVKQAPDAYGNGTLTRLHGEFTADNHHLRHLLLRIAVTAALPDPQPATTAR